MENEQRLQEILERIEQSTRKQTRYARLQFILSIVATVAVVAFLLVLVRIVPQLQEIVSLAETVLSNLEYLTTELAKADLTGMVENIDTLVGNVDGLVSVSQTGIEDAIQKINGIDFDALNDAIQDLSNVVEPVAKFFKTFKFG